MVSVKMLEDLGITEPTAGMKIQLTVVVGWQEKKRRSILPERVVYLIYRFRF